MPIRISAREARRLRLTTQRLQGADPVSVAETVRHMLALQAQDFGQALWAIGVRTPGATRADVLAALASGQVVRTLPMRGTLHFVPAEDLGWMLQLTSGRTLQSASSRLRALGLDQATLDRAESIVHGELRGGNSRSRDELMQLLAANGVSPKNQRGYHLIFYLTQRALVCWGPPRGTQQALVLVDEWIAHPRSLERGDALREFAVRYFASHGPATLDDFAWWTKLTLTDARAALEAARRDLTALELEGETLWIATTEWEAARASVAKPGTRALPGFDEYLLGYRNRSLALAAEHAGRVVPGSNGIFRPTIVAEGRVVGTWRRGPKGIPIEPEYFAAARGSAQPAFAREAMAFARFLS